MLMGIVLPILHESMLMILNTISTLSLMSKTLYRQALMASVSPTRTILCK